MNSFYLVFAHKNGEIPIYDAYSDPNIAMNIALSIAKVMAKDKNWIDNDPKGMPLADGSVLWMFLDTSKDYVGVRLINIKEPNVNPTNSNMPSRFSLNDNNAVSIHNPTTHVPPPLNPADLSLPGGFADDGTALTMQDIKLNPWRVKSTVFLTGHQKMALITARIRKMPHNKWNLYSGTGMVVSFNQKEVLNLLEKNNSAQDLSELIDMECLVLDKIYGAFKDTF